MGQIFKTSLFGFEKKSVMSYIEALAQNYNGESAAKDRQLDQCIQENTALKQKTAELEKKLKSMETERDYIANAIIQAEQEAQRMMEAAKQDVAARRTELEKAIEEDVRRSNEVKQHLIALQKSAIEAIHEYEEKLGRIIDGENAG